jgi:membrane-associated protein
MNAHTGAPTLPWEGKAQRADKVIVLAIMASAIYGYATLPLIGMLIDSHPVLLAAIRGGMTSIVNLGARASLGDGNLFVAIVIGVPATIMFDWAYWWAGQRWGEHSLHMMLGQSRKTEARLVRVKHWTEKYGAILVVLSYWTPLPTPLIYAAAGWAGMRLVTFLILDVIGTLLWTGTWAVLGYWIGQPIVTAVKQYAHYSNYAMIAIVVVIVGRQIFTTRRQIRAAGDAALAERAARDAAEAATAE